MRRFVQTNLILIAAISLLASYAAVGALAGPDVTPWPEFLGDGASAGVQTPDLPEQVPDGVPPEFQHPTSPDGTGPDGGVAGATDLGVPQESPACEILGCAWVETPDGETRYLPQPAIDGIQNADENRALAQEDGNVEGTDGPPDGIDTGPPDGVPTGGVDVDAGEQGPPEGVPQGPPEGVPTVE